MSINDIFRGPPTPAKWTALGEYLRGQRITGGRGIMISSNPITGTVVKATARRDYAAGGSRYTHPFEVSTRIESETLNLYVSYGVASYATIADDGDPPYNAEIAVAWDSEADPIELLDNDPNRTTEAIGSSALSASTNYGVWLVLKGDSGTITNPFVTDDEYTQLVVWGYLPAYCKIDVSSTQTSRLSAYSGAAGEVGFFLARVEVDAILATS